MIQHFLIESSNIKKTFSNGFKALNGVSFNVEEGSCFGFLGPNGAGKTTLMNIISGRLSRDKVDNDNLKVFNNDPAINAIYIKSNTGIVPQNSNLDADLTVSENLKVYSRFFNMSNKETNAKIKELLVFFELEEKANNKASELSGGMVRRLLIARALMPSPSLIIMDEPTVGLDPQVRQVIWKKIRQLKENGITILLTTHYMEEAFQICDTIIIMNRGEKILEGNPKKLLRENIEKYVIEVFKSSRIFEEYDNIRVDKESEPLHYYSNDFDALKTLSMKLLDDEYLIRHTNLEDLFIKLTGGKLNEFQ